MHTNDEAPFPELRAAYLRAVARAWNNPAYQDALLEASKKGRRGALDLLERDFNFTFPFDVKFMIDVESRPAWSPVGTPSGWFGSADAFVIALPRKPARAEQGAAVLAHYCAKFPSLLGEGRHHVSAPPDFAKFGVITSQLIALTWANEAFAARLFDQRDARGLLQDAMGCIVPWNFLLKFEPAPGDSSDSDEYWSDFPRSKITVHLPQRPELDAQPVALAAYNATGGQYPFTCG
jgi:ribosomally synthesized peptide (two-chain TOMM family)